MVETLVVLMVHELVETTVAERVDYKGTEREDGH